MSRRSRIVAVLGGALVLASLFLAFRKRGPESQYLSAPVERGDVREVVGATGTLEAVTTVQVGSQVSGTIQSLQADFNSVVRRGQVVARLDPSLFEARLGQARANLVAAHASVERQRAAEEDAERKLTRARELAASDLLPASDLETAEANAQSAVAQRKSADAAVTQAEASVRQAEVDLGHTVIEAPIDGIVIARNVDVGQTVAASFQAPVLFVIANDLTRMRVNAAIDEADIGRVRVGQSVLFRVDAYPDREFRGEVQQVRLQPLTVQNVVTYNTIIAVDNALQQLMPGMTATVSVIVRRSDGVLRVPVAALRFRPESEQGAGRERDTGSGAAFAAAERGATPGSNAPDARRAGAGGKPARETLLYVLGPQRRPQPAPVRLGLSDGQYIEVLEGLEEGALVVTGDATAGARPAARAGSSPAATNPFSPQFQRRQR